VILQPVLRPVDGKDLSFCRSIAVLLRQYDSRLFVERTFVWLLKYRIHSKDYERKPDSSAAMIHISMIKNMLKLLETKYLQI
jgi:hypothetical protein